MCKTVCDTFSFLNKKILTAPVKKLKANTKNAQAEDSDDDSDEDDSDVGVKYLLQKTLESDEDDDTFVSDTEDNGEEEDVGEEVNSDVDEEEVNKFGKAFFTDFFFNFYIFNRKMMMMKVL